MALDFTVKDTMHKVVVKFIRCFLPGAKKPYNLKAVHLDELGIHEIASKAEVYNLETSPKVIEEGLTEGMKLILYLAADGYRITTPLFSLKIRIPGEYDGSETHLPEGVTPLPRLLPGAALREYMSKTVQVEFDGMDQTDGLIAEARDEATGLIDEVATIGNILTVHGLGLKIEADEAHKDRAGLFFEDEEGILIRAPGIAVNQPLTLKAAVPAALTAGKAYTLAVVTQSSMKHGSTLLKEPRKMRSEFTLIAYA